MNTAQNTFNLLKYDIRVDKDGSKRWYKDGKLHREDGPAIERANGGRYWYKDGKRHRENGPAIERANDEKQWYLNGKKVDK